MLVLAATPFWNSSEAGSGFHLYTSRYSTCTLLRSSASVKLGRQARSSSSVVMLRRHAPSSCSDAMLPSPTRDLLLFTRWRVPHQSVSKHRRRARRFGDSRHFKASTTHLGREHIEDL